ncbi:hypothetical protein [Pseudofrankia inefficax]|uniref:hypothetical protein n=1 Tax=Pseudofrankia inefficax (strain DSM 45817 / CECT 9037 / DDB 130130 / EuI1c) TaxID=298654 RepID=UPI00030DE15E|nr:hypothetical protein [Pseudofrankia inefficax]
MSDIAWDDVHIDFDPDVNGVLPDVVIESAGIDDWQAVLDFVNARGWAYDYGDEAGNRLVLPTAQQFFARRDRGTPLAVWPGPGMRVNFWSLDEGTIDADVDLRELQGQEPLDQLCDLIRALGQLLRKPVVMLAEGCGPPRYPILAYDVEADRVVVLARSTAD